MTVFGDLPVGDQHVFYAPAFGTPSMFGDAGWPW
jgi:hypothetical protein